MKLSCKPQFIFLFLIPAVILVMSCSDEYDRDKGPTDIRIENILYIEVTADAPLD